MPEDRCDSLSIPNRRRCTLEQGHESPHTDGVATWFDMATLKDRIEEEKRLELRENAHYYLPQLVGSMAFELGRSRGWWAWFQAETEPGFQTLYVETPLGQISFRLPEKLVWLPTEEGVPEGASVQDQTQEQNWDRVQKLIERNLLEAYVGKTKTTMCRKCGYLAPIPPYANAGTYDCPRSGCDGVVTVGACSSCGGTGGSCRVCNGTGWADPDFTPDQVAEELTRVGGDRRPMVRALAKLKAEDMIPGGGDIMCTEREYVNEENGVHVHNYFKCKVDGEIFFSKDYCKGCIKDQTNTGD